ncbi:MAG: hypothetical protein QOE44_1732 [Solirubrobacteraceae bacterium]|nr:hypothetical protein [Solirubrobacteraceae bacterium]
MRDGGPVSVIRDARLPVTDPGGPAGAEPDVFTAYVPRALMRRLATGPGDAVETIDGTLMFADISGFTRLSERLARLGRVGAEHLVEAIGSCFAELLVAAYANGGSLLKFAGDALLLLFDGENHAGRACRAATVMRQTLREVGQIEAGGARAVLRMSVGVNSGAFHLFVVGDSHRELIIAGPPATTTVELEHEAGAGQILLSRATAALLPARCVGAPLGGGVLLRRTPLDHDMAPAEPRWAPSPEEVASCVPTALRAHVRGGRQPPEHRTVTVAFVRFSGVDDLVRRDGPEATAEALHELIVDVQCAADELEVALLGSDLEADGGKLMLTAGAPRAVGDDEERMLLAMRRVVEGDRRIPVRVGVNRGAVFAGDVGPGHRRTYTTMGDATNLAARLMSRAPNGELWATAGVLDRSATSFDLRELPPFMVKGKSRPVTAWSVGRARRSPTAAAPTGDLPLVGRAEELAAIEAGLGRARVGRGGLIELTGESGVGKSRLAMEAREAAAGDMRVVSGLCDAYSSGTPYALWRDLVRQLLGLGWDDPDEVVLDRLRREVAAEDPDLLEWLPLLGIVVDADAPPTPAVDALAREFRRDRTHEVVIRFLRRELRVPTLVEIEQAHLMDEASAGLLEAMVGALAESSWLVLVTSRATGSGFVAPSGDHVEHLAPKALSDPDALRLAQAATEARPVPPYVVGLAVERAGGNPQFLLDLLALGAGSDELPDSAEAAAMARIDGLEPNDRALVRRLAVLGMSFFDRDVEVVLEPGGRVPDAETWRRLEGLVSSEDGQHRFARATLREAAYAALPFRTRRAIHARVAGQVERRLERGGEGDRAALSWHHLEAGQPERAMPHALAAAELAASRSAHADAARLYRRAIEAARASETPAAELVGVWEALGEAQRRTGEPAAAHAAFTAARRLAGGDPIRLAELFYLHAGVASRAGKITAAVRWAGRALAAVEDLESQEVVALRARLWSALAGVRLRQGRNAEAERSSLRAIADAEQAGEERALAHACWVLDGALVRLGRPAEATHSERAIEIYKRLGDTENLARVLSNLGIFAAAAGRWDRAMELYQEGADHATRAGDVTSAAYGDCNIGETLSDQGRFEEAEPRLRRALQVWDGSGDEQGSAYARLLLGRLAVRVGAAEAGQRRLERALEDLARLRCDMDAGLARLFLAEAAVADGRPNDALGIVGELDDTVEESGLLLRIRALALVELGSVEEAREALEASLERARGCGSDFDAAEALDGLAALVDEAEAAPLRLERDRLIERLGIHRLPGPGIERREAGVASGVRRDSQTGAGRARVGVGRTPVQASGPSSEA